MRRYIIEGHDIKSASDMKVAIDSYGKVKGCQAAVVKIQGVQPDHEEAHHVQHPVSEQF